MAALFDQDKYFSTGEWKVAANSASSHYEKLGFRSGDTLSDKQIIEAFHLREDWWTQKDKIARRGQAHPVIKELGPFIQDAIKNLIEAKKTLSDPVKKAQYDKILNDEIVRKTEEDLIRFIHFALQDDNMISEEEMRNLLNMADTLKIGRDKGKEIILYEMEKAGATFKPESDSGNTTSSSTPTFDIILNKTYYEILGVSEDAGYAEIKNAYDIEYKKYDEARDKKRAGARWIPVSEAWECLRDKTKKRKYDEEQKRKRNKDLTDDGGPKLEIKDESGNERRNYEFKDMRLGIAQSVTVIAKNGGGGTLDASIKTSHPWLIVDTNKIHQSKLPHEIIITVDPKRNPSKNTFGGKDNGQVEIVYKNGHYTINIAYKMIEDEADLKRFRRILTTISLVFGFFFGLVIFNLIEGIDQNGLIFIAAFIGTISVSIVWGYKDAGGAGAIGWGIGTAVGVFILFAILQAWFPHALLTVVWALIYGSVANILSDFIRRAIRQRNYQVPIGSGLGIIALTAMLIIVGIEGVKKERKARTVKSQAPRDTYTGTQQSMGESEDTIKLGDKIYNKSALGFTTKLGFATRFITTQLQKSYGLKDNLGALAYDIEPNSPATKAGIKSGDVIIKYNGNKIKDPLHLNRLITKTEIYKGEEIVVIRDGKKVTLNTAILKSPKTRKEIEEEAKEHIDKNQIKTMIEIIRRKLNDLSEQHVEAGKNLSSLDMKTDSSKIADLEAERKILAKKIKENNIQKEQLLSGLSIRERDVLRREEDRKYYNDPVEQQSVTILNTTTSDKQLVNNSSSTQHQQPTSKSKDSIVKRVELRSSSRDLSKDDVKDMLGSHNFYDSVWNKGGDFTNNYEAQVINGDKVVIDHATGLMWHQSGSLQKMNWGEAYQWVRELNRVRYAGYQNWRLPTIDEAVTLLESRKYGGENGLYIDPVFDTSQKIIWTSDEKAKTERSWIGTTSVSGRYWWCVNFTNGTVSWLIRLVESQKHVRPVRTMR